MNQHPQLLRGDLAAFLMQAIAILRRPGPAAAIQHGPDFNWRRQGCGVWVFRKWRGDAHGIAMRVSDAQQCRWWKPGVDSERAPGKEEGLYSPQKCLANGMKRIIKYSVCDLPWFRLITPGTDESAPS